MYGWLPSSLQKLFFFWVIYCLNAKGCLHCCSMCLVMSFNTHVWLCICRITHELHSLLELSRKYWFNHFHNQISWQLPCHPSKNANPLLNQLIQAHLSRLATNILCKAGWPWLHETSWAFLPTFTLRKGCVWRPNGIIPNKAVAWLLPAARLPIFFAGALGASSLGMPPVLIHLLFFFPLRTFRELEEEGQIQEDEATRHLL